jgi:hypothetical protein
MSQCMVENRYDLHGWCPKGPLPFLTQRLIWCSTAGFDLINLVRGRFNLDKHAHLLVCPWMVPTFHSSFHLIDPMASLNDLDVCPTARLEHVTTIHGLTCGSPNMSAEKKNGSFYLVAAPSNLSMCAKGAHVPLYLPTWIKRGFDFNLLFTWVII